MKDYEYVTNSGITVALGEDFDGNERVRTVRFTRGREEVLIGINNIFGGSSFRVLVINAISYKLMSEVACVLGSSEGALDGLTAQDIAGIIDCRKNEPLHYHHDGCPAFCDESPLKGKQKVKESNMTNEERLSKLETRMFVVENLVNIDNCHLWFQRKVQQEILKELGMTVEPVPNVELAKKEMREKEETDDENS